MTKGTAYYLVPPASENFRLNIVKERLPTATRHIEVGEATVGLRLWQIVEFFLAPVRQAPMHSSRLRIALVTVNSAGKVKNETRQVSSISSYVYVVEILIQITLRTKPALVSRPDRNRTRKQGYVLQRFTAWH